MRILVASIKGGVGKTAISTGLATYLNSTYVTNDLINTKNSDNFQIEANRKRIPMQYAKLEDVVYDFGAMYSQLDSKLSHAAKICDVYVIPTLTDALSLNGTIKTFELLNTEDKLIVVIINNFSKQKKHDDALLFLKEKLGDVPILAIRSTTLFERIAQHGKEWLANIHHKGEWQLNKSKLAHELVYAEIIRLGRKQ
jgi:cellulose biosynthesis protein BcsQ